MLSPRKTCNWQQNESYNDNLSALEACDRYLESNKRQICRQSIVRTYHYHWPLTYNDWPINVELSSIMVVGGVLLRITALLRAVGQGWLDILYY